jgi:hypothetical protein
MSDSDSRRAPLRTWRRTSLQETFDGTVLKPFGAVRHNGTVTDRRFGRQHQRTSGGRARRREWRCFTLLSTLSQSLWVACKWLSPLVLVVAISALIACATTTAVFPVQGVVPTGPSQPPEMDVGSDSVITRLVEPQGVVTRVSCPDNPSYVADLRVDSVMALDLVTEGQCEMTPLASGS